MDVLCHGRRCEPEMDRFLVKTVLRLANRCWRRSLLTGEEQMLHSSEKRKDKQVRRAEVSQWSSVPGQGHFLTVSYSHVTKYFSSKLADHN